MPAPADPPSLRVLSERLRIGRRITHLRMQQKLSQEQLAELTGISRQSVYRTETGAVAARLDWLILISDALAVPLVDLVRYDEP